MQIGKLLVIQLTETHCIALVLSTLSNAKITLHNGKLLKYCQVQINKAISLNMSYVQMSNRRG